MKRSLKPLKKKIVRPRVRVALQVKEPLPKKSKQWAVGFLFFAVGLSLGVYFTRDVRSRPIYQPVPCHYCWGPNELAGAMTSALIQHAPGILPKVIMETEKTIVIDYPGQTIGRHYIVFPKKDIKDVTDLSIYDKEYLYDAYQVMSYLLREKNIYNYRIGTNGPGLQDIRYLHFHLYEIKGPADMKEAGA